MTPSKTPSAPTATAVVFDEHWTAKISGAEIPVALRIDMDLQSRALTALMTAAVGAERRAWSFAAAGDFRHRFELPYGIALIADATNWTSSQSKATFHLSVTVRPGVMPASTLVNGSFGAVLPDPADLKALAVAVAVSDLDSIMAHLAAAAGMNCFSGSNCTGAIGTEPSCAKCKSVLGGVSWKSGAGMCTTC